MADLNDLIRDQLARHPFESNEDLARRVVNATPDGLIMEFYQAAVTPLVADLKRLARNQAITNALSDSPPEMPRPKSRSRKVAAIRDWWSAMLASEVRVADGAVKSLGDCTVIDIDYLISDRRTRASELSAKADEYQRLRDHLERSGVKFLRDAPAMAAS